jgi:starvation-inducible DNA-binding protein
MTANSGLDQSQRHGTTGILTTLLADQFVLSSKALKGHWNVAESTVTDLPEFLWKHHSSLHAMMDSVAKRIRAVGSNAPGTLTEFLNATALNEQPGIYADAESVIAELLTDHEIIVRRLRDDAKQCAECFNDPGTADLLSFMLRQHEYLAWMLRSLLRLHENPAKSAAMPHEMAREGSLPIRVVFTRSA